MSPKAAPILGLDLVRFAAAMMVVLYHLAFKAWATPDDLLRQLLGGPSSLPAGWGVSWFGWVGVQVFFVISGFVIAWSAERATPRLFLRGRIARLVPGMWAAASLGALILLAWGGAPGGVAVLWLKSLTFYPLGPWIGGQFWTLPIEACFYGLVLLLLARNAFRHLEGVAFQLAMVSGFYWLATSLPGVADHFGAYTRFLLLQHGCYFALGIIIWSTARNGFSWPRLAFAGLTVATAWLQIRSACANEHLAFGLSAQPLTPFLVWLALTAAICAAIRWNGLALRHLGGAAGAIRLLGLATYPLYLLHFHVGGVAMLAAARLGLAPLAVTALGVLAAVAASLGMALFLEPALKRPVLAAFDALSARFARPLPVADGRGA
ncbi:MAG: hypothetical protein JWP35_153 [Caulobacter sp.]|nr:hypothetical protein [Caulobacter sp.]